MDFVHRSFLVGGVVPCPRMASAGWSSVIKFRPCAGRRADCSSTGVISIDKLKGQSPGGVAAFALLLIAVVFRKGICPAHAWVADAAETGPALPTALLLNGHFGALLVAKLIVPLFPLIDSLFPVLSYLAILTALYVAIRALAENSPRRLLAYLALSQSACILSGLESRTAEGIAGAIVHWFVVAICTVALFGILRLLEVRFGENLTASKHLGLAEHAPRLAVSFVIFGLALVGLPGTLGFCSQDLFDSRSAHIAPSHRIAAAYCHRDERRQFLSFVHAPFLGKRRTGFTVMADALPRERWILAAGVLFVVFGGLFPNAVVIQRSVLRLNECSRRSAPELILTLSERFTGSLGNYQSLPRADAWT